MDKSNLSYSELCTVQLHSSGDISDNIDSSSDENDCIEEIDEQTAETCKLILIQNVNEPNATYRRSQNSNTNSKFSYENDDFIYYNHLKTRQAPNKTSKKFLFLFGFATTIIILSQIYLSLYYSDPLGRGNFFFIIFFSFNI